MSNAAIATRIMSINRLCRLFVVITCSSYPDSVGCSSSSLVPRILSARLEACGLVQRPIALSSSQAQNGNNVMNDKRSRLADTGPGRPAHAPTLGEIGEMGIKVLCRKPLFPIQDG